GRDAGPRDAGPPEGECWLVEQLGCAPGLTCRRTRAGTETPFTGPSACMTPGTMDEWDSTTNCWGPGRDLCAAGLFCLSFGRCARFCDPAGDPCPPTPRGSPQQCVMLEGAAPDPYCSPQ
ncbi:MAG: hypothetical protein K8H88_32635, partial [Sandaracinaceae bacterium]|nr:hypothetical protein [Sandaracinaceae bacterium]